MINVLACDPGLRRFGAALFQTDGREHRALRVEVFKSELHSNDFGVRSCDDRVRRSRELARWLDDLVRGVDLQLIVAETMSFPRGTAPLVSMALSWGVLSAFAERRGVEIISALPTYWRTHLIGEKPKRAKTEKARKAATQIREDLAHARAVAALHGSGFGPLALRLRPDELQLHALDAAGVFVWALSHPTLQRLAS